MKRATVKPWQATVSGPSLASDGGLPSVMPFHGLQLGLPWKSPWELPCSCRGLPWVFLFAVGLAAVHRGDCLDIAVALAVGLTVAVVLWMVMANAMDFHGMPWHALACHGHCRGLPWCVMALPRLAWGIATALP